MIRDWASLSNKHKIMNSWMHYVKKESMKHNNNAANSVQGGKIGHQKIHYWESESYSGSWHAIGHMGPRFKDGITQGSGKKHYCIMLKFLILMQE
jgi:hypothetical protein